MGNDAVHENSLAASIRSGLKSLSLLPSNLGGLDPEGRTGLERFQLMGWRFAAARVVDGLFLQVVVKPDGFWLDPMPAKGTSLWYYLRDGLGRPRGTVFYFPGHFGLTTEARPPSAHVALVPRFSIVRRLGADNYPMGMDVLDAGVVIRRFGDYPDIVRSNYRSTGELLDAISQRRPLIEQDQKAAQAWLGARVHRAGDVLAHWDDAFDFAGEAPAT